MQPADAVPLYETAIAGGKHWSFTVGKGTLIRLVDIEGVAQLAFAGAGMIAAYFRIMDQCFC